MATGARVSEIRTGARPPGCGEPLRAATVLGDGDVALGVIRSLAEAGIAARHVFTDPREHAHRSRFVRRFFPAPHPEDGCALVDLLVELGERHPGTLLIPCDDVFVLYVARHRDALLPWYALAVPAEEVVKEILDKSALCRNALEVDVPMARTWFPASVKELRELHHEFIYPCLLKPTESHRFFDAFGQKLLVAHSPAELERAFTESYESGIPAMVAEIVAGGDSSLFHYRSYLDAEGDVLAEMCTQKLRQHPVGFGVASYSRTVPMIPEIRVHALSLLRHVGYQGVSSAEFKRDARNDRFRLMEINVRPVLPERLFVEAGVNFCAVAYLDAAENIRTQAAGYETDVYWVHNIFETIRLLYHRNLTLADYLKPYSRRRLVTCVPFMQDPAPFFARLLGVVGKMLAMRPRQETR